MRRHRKLGLAYLPTLDGLGVLVLGTLQAGDADRHGAPRHPHQDQLLVVPNDCEVGALRAGDAKAVSMNGIATGSANTRMTTGTTVALQMTRTTYMVFPMRKTRRVLKPFFSIASWTATTSGSSCAKGSASGCSGGGQQSSPATSSELSSSSSTKSSSSAGGISSLLVRGTAAGRFRSLRDSISSCEAATTATAVPAQMA